MKLSPVALGIGLGSVWGAALFITTWVCFLTGYGRLFLEVLAQSIYPGYSISPLGSLVGLVFGFADGFVGGGLIALVYNKASKQ